MRVYYNEFDPFAAAWLRDRGRVPEGVHGGTDMTRLNCVGCGGDIRPDGRWFCWPCWGAIPHAAKLKLYLRNAAAMAVYEVARNYTCGGRDG